MKIIKRGISYVLLAIAVSLNLQCQDKKETPEKQTVKVDFNFSGRRLKEVHDTSYESWVIEEQKEAKKTFGNITIQLKGDFNSKWFKVGVQAPYYSRLASDGLVSNSKMELVINGLEAGGHTLLTYHNALDRIQEVSAKPIKIYVDNQLVKELAPSSRVLSKKESEIAYVSFKAKAGKPVIIKFELEANASIKQLVINGFELDTPNIKKQANTPFPETGDLHVVAKDKLMLTWKAAKGAVGHKLFFGVDKDVVSKAVEESPVFKGKMSENRFLVSDLYSMTTYYWRVDEIAPNGEVTKGEVWSFKPAQLAFPEAEGYGRFAIGGRGGKVIAVTNLNDDGPGSLRDAVKQDIGPRTIVFNVSGNIELKSRLVVDKPYITIAGQTAPGEGITISRAPIGLTGDDGMIRFLKVRIGAGRTYDGMGLTGANHSIIDHCSISWTIDESFSSRSAHNITLQRTLISEALNLAGHHKYGKGAMHGYAATIGGDVGSFHHNLLAHNYGRNWSMGGGLNGDGYYGGKLDIRNNVVYNWGKRTTDGGANQVNFVNNYYKPGASSKLFKALKVQHEGVGKGQQRYYFKGNVMPGYFDETNQDAGKMIQTSKNAIVDYETFVDEPFFKSYVTTHSAKAAYKNVLSDVGAHQPFTDKRDIRIIDETLKGTYAFKGSKSGFPGMIDTEEDAGGWPTFASEKRPEDWDTDHDGLPNWWEATYGLNPKSPEGDFSDTNADTDKDGFTQLDDYLHWMAQPHFFVKKNELFSFSLKPYFKGYELKPVFKCSNVKNGNISLKSDKIQFETNKTGFTSFVITVTDAEGDSMSRTFNFYIK